MRTFGPLVSATNEDKSMSVTLPLDQMTAAEKLQLMEDIWENLSRKPDEMPSPGWHREVLEERRQMVREGKARYMDWEQAKREIRASLVK